MTKGYYPEESCFFDFIFSTSFAYLCLFLFIGGCIYDGINVNHNNVSKAIVTEIQFKPAHKVWNDDIGRYDEYADQWNVIFELQDTKEVVVKSIYHENEIKNYKNGQIFQVGHGRGRITNRILTPHIVQDYKR